MNAEWAPPALISALADAKYVVAMTGAGMSAESGVPTFRDAQTGLWARFDPEQLATPEAFERDPVTAWNWYRWRRELVSRARPNAGHEALATLQARFPTFRLITQNVDGLHQAAGSEGVVEFHGNLFANLCDREGVVVRESITALEDQVPRCPRCDAPLRPGVVLFGEIIPEPIVKSSYDAAAACDVFISIGTSSLVYPAAGLAEAAMRAGATFVEINTEDTPLSSLADHRLRGPAGEVLPQLVAALDAAGN
jgi:NAD-dependent deacetylase